ncbi:MAG TPA: alpha/beta hydrolase [Bryobacteraceae bacterium]|nr:alpha/beta hydrolase [Bryobacteraceae bacterium]
MRDLVLIFLLCFASLQAKNITGNWQGTLGEGTDDRIRLVVRIAKEKNAWAATLFSIDQGGDWGADQPLTSITLQGATFKFKVNDQSDFGAFEGTVNQGGDSIVGSWIQGGYRQPITFRRATSKTAWKDPSPHSIRFVTVGAGVKLEVLDWGGTGRPVLLLAGNGNTAHVFDPLAGKLAATYHVYGLTRRGFGASSKPPSGYDADRLADDVLEAMDLLRLKKPVLIGHSIAGGELSSIGSRHADKVAGLIYLDSGYSYAYYDSTVGDPGTPPLGALPPRQRAVWEGRQKYTRIQGPVLAIYAFGDKPDLTLAEAQANAFEKGVPGAKVLRFPKAPHYIFLAEEAAILREIRAFIATLP